MKTHTDGCPRLQFWDAGEFDAPCLCDQQNECEHDWTKFPDLGAAQCVFCGSELWLNDDGDWMEYKRETR